GAWRGGARKRSMAERPEAERGLPTAIISMAQQARPNCAGQTEFLRARLRSFATVVSRIPSGSFSSSPIGSVPLQSASTPYIGVDDEHGEDEHEHLDQPEHAELVEGNGPWVEKDDLDVEDDEQHRGEAELHQGGVRQSVTRAELHHRRVPDGLHENPADGVIAAVLSIKGAGISGEHTLTASTLRRRERLRNDLGGEPARLHRVGDAFAV